MKKVAIRIHKSTVVGPLLVFVAAFLAMACETRVSAQNPIPTTVVTPTPIPFPTHTPTLIPPTEDASEQLLKLYGEVIETSNRTTESVKWTMSVVLTLITILVGHLARILTYSEV